MMDVMTRTILAVVAAMFMASTSAQPRAVDGAGIDPALVDRFLSRSDEPLRQYRGTRRLEASNARFRMSGWLEVETELSERSFTYRVLSEGGSAYIRNKVLRRALKGESDLIANGDPAKAAFNRENYELTAGDVQSTGEFTLLTRPLRKDMLLIDGALFVTAAGDLVRIEGRLSKSPSFWTHDVSIVRAYGRIAGVRVPLSLESTAKVRLAGTSTLTMRYEYASVNGAAVTAPASTDGSAVPAETASGRP